MSSYRPHIYNVLPGSNFVDVWLQFDTIHTYDVKVPVPGP